MASSRPLIMIVDDESRIRRILSMALEESGFDTVMADDGESALMVYEKNEAKPDLIVLDYMMPGMDGFTFLQELRKKSSVPVIILSAREELNSKTKAFELGADDYVTKPFALEELTARIKAVLKRSAKNSSPTPVVSNELKNGPLKLDLASRTAFWNDSDLNLTDTEFRLLEVMMKNPGKLLSHDELLRKVWGAEFIGEVNYLRVAFARIRKKIKDAGGEGSVISAYSKVGYIMSDLRASKKI